MAFMKVKDLRNSATTANNTLTYMYIKLTCTVQGSFLEQHILWPDNLQTQSLRSQTCWRALLDAPEPGGLNTHTHTQTFTHAQKHWLHGSIQQFQFVWSYLLHQAWWCQGRSISPVAGLSQTWSGTRLHHSASQPESGLSSWNNCPRCSWNTRLICHIYFAFTVCQLFKKKSQCVSPTVFVHGTTGWSGSGQCGEQTPCDLLQRHGTTWPASQCDLWKPRQHSTFKLIQSYGNSCKEHCIDDDEDEKLCPGLLGTFYGFINHYRCLARFLKHKNEMTTCEEGLYVDLIPEG